MNVCYRKLMKLLKSQDINLVGLRRRLNLLPSDIAKIETNRFIGVVPNLMICKYFRCDTFDIMEILPQPADGEVTLTCNKRILESHSYTPKVPIEKEFQPPIKYQ